MSHYPDETRGWWSRRWWWLDAISDIQRDTMANRAVLVDVVRKIDALTRKVITMGAREDAAYEKLSGDIQSVKDGWASLVAERDQYKAALEAADANAAAQVQAALDADSEFDAGKIEAADAALAELVAPAPPADNGGGEVPPADNGGGEEVPPADGGETPVEENPPAE